MVCLLLSAAGCESRASLLGDGSSDARQDSLAMLLTNGETCAGDRQCLSGTCRDGVCCDLACIGPCSRCDTPSSKGTCLFVGAGQIPPPGKSCPSSAQEECKLDGRCDGQGSCRNWPAGTVCRPAQCEPAPEPTKLKLAWHCDGQGSCSAFAPDQIDCAPYGCDVAQSRCFPSCSTAAPLSCKKGVSCDAGRCGGALPPLGAPCTTGDQCDSAACVSGVCCSSECANLCESCTLDGVAGKCVPVPAGSPPQAGKSCVSDPSDPCSADGMCDGRKKCRVAASTSPCGVPTCQSSTLTLHLCNGDPLGPSCVKKQVSCGAYVCQPGGARCYGSCISNSQCNVGYLCAQNQCVQCVSETNCKPGQVCLNNQCE